MPYLAPDSIPAGGICRPLWIPDDDKIVWAVNGALYELTLAHNWEPSENVSGQAIADAMAEMLELYFSEECTQGSPTMPAGALVTRNDDLSWPFATVTAWQAELWNEGAWDSDVTDRLTAPENGLYEIGANLAVVMNAYGECYADLQLNGSTVVNRTVALMGYSTGVAYVHLHTIIPLDAGDYVRVVHPTLGAGATYSLATLAGYSPRFWMVRQSETGE